MTRDGGPPHLPVQRLEQLGRPPAPPSDPDTSSTEVGVKFTVDTPGTITGIRFYKGTGNTGTHVGHLWTATGTQLASVTFSGESATGWQQATFSSPVTVSAGTTYVASYLAPNGHYAEDDGFFAASGHRRPSPAPAEGRASTARTACTRPPARRRLPHARAMPSSNYWVDVVFSPSGGGTRHHAADRDLDDARRPARPAWPPTTTVTATFSEPVQAGTIAMTPEERGRHRGRRHHGLRQRHARRPRSRRPRRWRRHHVHRHGQRRQGPRRQHHDADVLVLHHRGTVGHDAADA